MKRFVFFAFVVLLLSISFVVAGSCITDSDCSFGEVCSGWVCVPSGGGPSSSQCSTFCGSFYVIDPVAQQQVMYSYAFCDDTNKCAPQEDVVVSHGQGGTCDYDVWSLMQKWSPGSTIKTEIDYCAYPQVCTNHVCEFQKLQGQGCKLDKECEQGLTCLDGICSLVGPSGVQCIDYEDCSSGEICLGGKCANVAQNLCGQGKIPFVRLDDPAGGHVALKDTSMYSHIVCLEPSGEFGMITHVGICSATDKKFALALSSSIDAVALGYYSNAPVQNFPYPLCLQDSQEKSIGLCATVAPNTDCQAPQTCVVSVSDLAGGHVAACGQQASYYDICCTGIASVSVVEDTGTVVQPEPGANNICPALCPIGTTCVDGSCQVPPACVNGQCAPGLFCNQETNLCLGIPPSCTPLCSGSQMCINGACQEPQNCVNNVCPSGDLACVNDQCVPIQPPNSVPEGGACAADSWCQGDLICENGICAQQPETVIPPVQPPGTCLGEGSDSDGDGVKDNCDMCPQTDDALDDYDQCGSSFSSLTGGCSITSTGCLQLPDGKQVDKKQLPSCKQLGGVLCKSTETCVAGKLSGKFVEGALCCKPASDALHCQSSDSQFLGLQGGSALSGACVDPDNDGHGTQLLCPQGATSPSQCQEQPCTTVPSQYTETVETLSFYSLTSLILTFSVIFVFYFRKGKI